MIINLKLIIENADTKDKLTINKLIIEKAINKDKLAINKLKKYIMISYYNIQIISNPQLN